MRKNFFLCLLLMTGLILLSCGSALSAGAPADWAWLLDQVEAGNSVIVLPNDIICDLDEGLNPSEPLRIEGNAFTITGAIVDGGTVIFKDVKLRGTNGNGDNPGGSALTLTGDDAVAVLMGTTRAEGGTSGVDGTTGGHGVHMTGARQGLILNNYAAAIGGVGQLQGGHGVYVEGCHASLLVTDSASLVGSPGLAEGGCGLIISACGEASLQKEASITGGASPYSGGHGIHSADCPDCTVRKPIALSGMTMTIGGVGKDGGDGIRIERSAPGDTADLALKDDCMAFAGDGETPGAALKGTRIALSYEGAPQLHGGKYYADPADAVQLEDCTILDDSASPAVTEGTATEAYPASDVSQIIRNTLSQTTERKGPEPIDDPVLTQALATSLNGFSVDSGNVSQVNISGNSLKFFMYTGALDGRMQFRQRLMDDGEDGTRLVMIASASDLWPTVDATVPGLRKLLDIGISQLAYTCVPPVYYERALDLQTLVDAVDAYDGDVARVMCGTVDDAIIFILEDGTRDYQELLMPEVIRPI